MVFNFLESVLEAEQSSNSDQSFFLKHPVHCGGVGGGDGQPSSYDFYLSHTLYQSGRAFWNYV